MNIVCAMYVNVCWKWHNFRSSLSHLNGLGLISFSILFFLHFIIITPSSSSYQIYYHHVPLLRILFLSILSRHYHHHTISHCFLFDFIYTLFSVFLSSSSSSSLPLPLQKNRKNNDKIANLQIHSHSILFILLINVFLNSMIIFLYMLFHCSLLTSSFFLFILSILRYLCKLFYIPSHHTSCLNQLLILLILGLLPILMSLIYLTLFHLLPPSCMKFLPPCHFATHTLPYFCPSANLWNMLRNHEILSKKKCFIFYEFSYPRQFFNGVFVVWHASLTNQPTIHPKDFLKYKN